MPEPNETYAKIQNMRVKNLEQQVHMMRAELQRIREGLLPQKDIIRLTSLADKLKELNDVLKDLRNHYNMEKAKQYEQKYFAEKETNSYQDEYQQNELEHMPSSTKILHDNIGMKNNIEVQAVAATQNIVESNTENRANASITDAQSRPFETCKNLLNEIKPPGSILGNHLIKLQDFRADPELRRQRLERKQKERLEQLRMKNETNHLVEEITNSSVVQPDSENFITNSTVENFKENQYRNEICRCSLADNNHNDSDLPTNALIISNNLREVVYDIVRDMDRDAIALTVVLETDQLYHVSVSTTTSGESLACFFSTEDAIQEAKIRNLFQEFLTLFVVNADNSMAQKDRILGHSFEFIKQDF